MLSRISSSVLVLSAFQLLSRVSAADVHFALNITNAIIAPDGYTRSTVTADGKIPGPLISGNIGDRFLINVTDSLTEPSMRRATSIHWHGMLHKMDHTVAMDGVSSVTQCPIVPGHSFMYNFTVPDQSGTYWYHSHLSTQYCDGLSAPLVIYDPDDPHKHLYDIDDESTIISLSDWYHTAAPFITDFAPPQPDSTIINGLGRWSVDPTSDLAVVRAQGGKRHRFRLISMSCFPSFTFSIEGHKLTVIEADGIETEPVTVDSLEIYVGQRYSIVVTMDKPIDNYWIRAIPSYPVNSTTINGINSAILRYDGAPIAEPCSIPSEDEWKEDEWKEPTLLNEIDLHPLVNPGAPGKPYPGGADVVLTLETSFNISDARWAINNVSFVPPSVPILFQVLSGAVNANDILPAGSVYGLPPNSTIEVNIPGGAEHPFHLHGHTFDVIRSAGSSTYNFENPVRRDVVDVGGIDDNVTFRFVTDNPGPWFLHCHIDWHLEGGLAIVFAEDAGEVKQMDPVNDDWSSLCPLYDKLDPDTILERPI